MSMQPRHPLPTPSLGHPAHDAESKSASRPWTKAEDDVVTRNVLADPSGLFTKWSSVAGHLPGRTGKQIRERWNNYLDPSIRREPFTRDDDLLLWKGHKEFGNRWVYISWKIFNAARSENQVKNRWNSAAFKRFVAAEFGPDAYYKAKQNTQGVPGSGFAVGEAIPVYPSAGGAGAGKEKKRSASTALDASDGGGVKIPTKKVKADMRGSVVHLADHQSLVDALALANKACTSSHGSRDASAALLLAMPGDERRLKEVLCILRHNIEVFTATDDDADAFVGGKKVDVQLGQVGLRCIHCRGVYGREPMGCASKYPSSVATIYGAALDIKMEHFVHCPLVPLKVKNKLAQFQVDDETDQESTEEYFTKSARELGMFDSRGAVFIDLNSAKAIADGKGSPRSIIPPKQTQVPSPKSTMDAEVVTLDDTDSASEPASKKTALGSFKAKSVSRQVSLHRPDQGESDDKSDDDGENMMRGSAKMEPLCEEQMRRANARMAEQMAEQQRRELARITALQKDKFALQKERDMLLEINAKLMRDNVSMKHELEEKDVLIHHYRNFRSSK